MNYDFADRLIELRRSRGLSQEELAKELGLSRQAVSKWERAESAPDIGNLVALSNIYDVSLDDLVRGNDEASAEGEGADAGTTTGTATEFPPPSYTEAVNVQPVITVAPTVDTSPNLNTTPIVAPASTLATTEDTALKKKNPLYTFPYPLLVVLIYLVFGFIFGLWHPMWVLFLTIPFYYWIASVITNDPEFAARHDRRLNEYHHGDGQSDSHFE